MTEQEAIEIATTWLKATSSAEIWDRIVSYCGPSYNYESLMRLRDEGEINLSPELFETVRRRYERNPNRPYWLVMMFLKEPSRLVAITVGVDDESGDVKQFP